VTFSPDEGVSVENGYLRGVWGSSDMWFEARAGLVQPFEGFGASDLSIGISSPLIEGMSASETQDTLYHIGDGNRMAAEVGVQWQDTALSVMVENTLTAGVSGADVVGDATLRDTDNRKNVVVVAHQLVGTYSGVTGYWAHGFTNLPLDPAGFVAGTNAATWRNRFDRLALFGSIGNGTLFGYVGGALGYDHTIDPATGDKSLFKSLGGFVEGNFAVTPWAVPYVRADYFDPSTSTAHNQVWALTAGTGLYTQNAWVIPELSLTRSSADTGRRIDTGAFVRAVAAY
jgi:hypothetical protein